MRGMTEFGWTGLCAAAIIGGVGAASARLVWIDADQDGLEDLVRIAPGSVAQLLMNEGDGTFRDAPEVEHDLLGDVRDAFRIPGGIDAADALVVVTDSATRVLHFEGGRPELWALLPGGLEVSARDFDDDGRTDLVIDDHLFRQGDAGTFTAVSLPPSPVIFHDATAAHSTDLGYESSPRVGSSSPETTSRELPAAGSVDTQALARAAVTADKLAPGSVEYRHLAPEVQLAGSSSADRAGNPTQIPGADDPGQNLVEPASRVQALGTDGDLVVTGLIHGHGAGTNTLAGALGIGWEGYGESLHVSHSGASSDGIGCWIFPSTSTGAAVKGQTYGQGPGVQGYSQAGWAGVQGNGGSGHGVSGGASSGAGVYGTSGTGAGVYGKSSDGHAGHFEIVASDNDSHAVNAETEGTGHAGRFVAHNADNTTSALSVLHEGAGPGLGAVTTGTGGAAWFDARNALTTEDAVSVSNAGHGNALSVTQDYVQGGQAAALDVSNSGADNALEITQLRSSANQPVVMLTNQSEGQGIRLNCENSSNDFSAMHVVHDGNGRGLWLDVNQNSALYATSTSNKYSQATIHAENLTASGGYGIRAIADGTAVRAEGGQHGILAQCTDADGTAGWFVGMGGAKGLHVVGLSSVDVLEIRGGFDLAERFDVNEEALPGTVLSIDPETAGLLQVSDRAYDRHVAGVVSGANNLEAGIILGEASEENPGTAVAMSGRVWVRCDATDHAIAPGDLLTTSDLPGHAMRISDRIRAQGAVLGKAMGHLDQGETGLVLALVTLQ